MTRAEYTKAYTDARKYQGRLTAGMMVQLKKVYLSAADEVAAIVADARARSLSELTIESRSRIEDSLRLGAENIRAEMERITPIGVRRMAGRVTEIDAQYIIDAIPDGQNVLTTAGVYSMAEGVNERVVRSVINRLFSDGYTLSERIWQASQDYPDQIQNVIASGFAQGRDPVKIARDIQVYVNDDKIKLAKRYGKLRAGTREYFNRIRRNVDYRALRLVRSELAMSLQESGALSGLANPAAQDSYDWILSPNREHWSCSCDENAAASPYEYSEIPGYPHPNCECRVQARLMDGGKFKEDLKKWTGGESVPYLDKWNREHYLAS